MTEVARTPNLPQRGGQNVTPKSLKKQTPTQEVLSNGVTDEGESQVEQSEEGQTEPVEEATNGAAAVAHTNDEEAEEDSVVPAGSVDEHGNVVNEEGDIIGKVDESVPAGSMVDQEFDVLDSEGNVIGKANPVGEAAEGAKEAAEGATEGVQGATEGAEGAAEGVEKPELKAPFGVQDNGEITNAVGEPIGKLAEGEPQDLVGQSIKEIDAEGNLKGASGSTIGKADLKSELLDKTDEAATGAGEEVPEAGVPGADEKVPGEEALEEAGEKVPGEEALEEAGEKGPGEEGLEEVGEKVPGEENLQDVAPDALPDLSILEGKKVNKLGKVVDDKGVPIGQLVEGNPKKLAGRKVDAEGKIWDDSGKVVGRAELLPETEREDEIESAPFEDFPDSIVDAKGNIIFENRIIGKVVKGDAKKLEGKKVDADGDILDKHGNVLGKAERVQEEEPVVEEPEEADVSLLEGKKVNKAGNVVDEDGKLFGRVVEGDIAKLVGLKCDAEGKLWTSGKVVGRAELIDAGERDVSSGAPFEDFPDAVVDAKGNVLFQGQVVGKLIEGDAKKLAGKKIDKDGEIVDKIGNVIGKAERWIEEDAPEPETVDMSILAGKRVNKLGNVVDTHGDIYGRLVEGDPKRLAGRMCDKDGNVRSEGGDIIGRAELVPESEREGEKTGPFADFQSPTVIKDGKVSDANGTIIGRVIQGDAKLLFGKPVDPDGDILDRNGNTLGKAERWEDEEKAVDKHPASGRKVNREGNVYDENGDLIAKLTEGEITKCAGKSIDDDGDVVDGKGKAIGHVTLLEDIPEPEPEPVPEEPKESEEEIEARKQLEQDKKLASQMAMCVQQSIDKIKPILNMITDAIDAAERQPKEDLDEQKLVDTVKPLIEEGAQILQEANGVIRGLDPDGRIAANAKHKTAAREATPEEYRLADVLKELTENVTKTIEQAKKKIAGMPHAKKELNPLWNLLAEPLGQILAAVGLLLSGVLGLVGRLLSGLGLGGLLDNLLGGLGIKGILQGLGLGMVTDSLTGKKKK